MGFIRPFVVDIDIDKNMYPLPSPRPSPRTPRTNSAKRRNKRKSLIGDIYNLFKRKPKASEDDDAVDFDQKPSQTAYFAQYPPPETKVQAPEKMIRCLVILNYDIRLCKRKQVADERKSETLSSLIMRLELPFEMTVEKTFTMLDPTKRTDPEAGVRAAAAKVICIVYISHV